MKYDWIRRPDVKTHNIENLLMLWGSEPFVVEYYIKVKRRK